jgi:A/G-specific adenine glycosylase
MKRALALRTAAPLFRRRLLAWYGRRGRALPWRETRDPYAILVSEIMLQQTQVATVIAYYRRWMARWPGFLALASATEQEVLHLWQGLGYYHRARQLHRLARLVVSEREGRLPESLEELRALPGIGPYTAGAIMAFAFDRPAAVVDANIARVLVRLLDWREPIQTGATRRRLAETAFDLQPVRGAARFNNALMELGALVCVPRAPRCELCPVRAFCLARRPAELPRQKPRAAPRTAVEDCAWIHVRGRFLLEQETGPRWRGLWRLPRVDAAGAEQLSQTNYTVTRHRVTLRVFRKSAPARLRTHQAWFRDPDALPLPSPHRRVIAHLLKTAAAP